MPKNEFKIAKKVNDNVSYLPKNVPDTTSVLSVGLGSTTPSLELGSTTPRSELDGSGTRNHIPNIRKAFVDPNSSTPGISVPSNGTPASSQGSKQCPQHKETEKKKNFTTFAFFCLLTEKIEDTVNSSIYVNDANWGEADNLDIFRNFALAKYLQENKNNIYIIKKYTKIFEILKKALNNTDIICFTKNPSVTKLVDILKQELINEKLLKHLISDSFKSSLGNSYSIFNSTVSHGGWMTSNGFFQSRLEVYLHAGPNSFSSKIQEFYGQGKSINDIIEIINSTYLIPEFVLRD